MVRHLNVYVKVGTKHNIVDGSAHWGPSSGTCVLHRSVMVKTWFIQRHALIIFMVISSRDAPVRSFDVSGGTDGILGLNDPYQSGFTANQLWGWFPPDMRSPDSCSPALSFFCGGIGQGCVFGLSPPQIVSIASEVFCNKGFFSPPLRHVIIMVIIDKILFTTVINNEIFF